VRAVKREFSKGTGIQLDFVKLASGASLARLRAEKGNAAMDVWLGGSGTRSGCAGRGLARLLPPKAWGELRPQLTKAVDGHYIPLYTGIHGFGSTRRSSRRRTSRPTTWKELGDPKYKGLIATPNPNTSGTGYVMMTTIVQIYGEDRGSNSEGHPSERRTVYPERRRPQPPGGAG